MKFQDVLKLYNLTPEDLKEIRKLKELLTTQQKREIAELTKNFVFEKLPNSAKLLEEIGAARAFSGTIENFIDSLLSFDEKFLIYLDSVIKTHWTNISLEDFLKDFALFSKELLKRIQVREKNEATFKKLTFLLILINLYIILTYLRGFTQIEEKDPVTKLSSKHPLIYKTHEILDRSRTIALIDIDNFKEYNLYYSYSVGNSILVTFSSVLQLAFPESYITRLQNDEFLIATEQPIGDVKRILLTLQKNFGEKPIQFPTPSGIQEIKIDFTAVLLNAKFQKSPTFDTLNWILYNAISKATKEHPERIHIVTANEVRKFLNDKTTIYNLIYALNHEKIKLAAQRVINIFTGNTLFVEILSRVILPSGKISTPSSFLSLIENSTIEKRLDKLMIEKLFQLIKKNQINSPASINISYPFLQDEFYWFLNRIEKYQIPDEKLIIELVERGDILSLPAIREKLRILRNRGIKIFIDDYGTKYSNYNLLKELEIDGIKIDGAAIENLKENPLDEIFVNSVISFAKLMDIYIVAEYIETQDHLKKLQELSTKNGFSLLYGQGYLWGKPKIIN